MKISRNDGLDIRFEGTENVEFNHIRQTIVVKPGRYQFSAEIKADQLTTDQGPFFHIFDPVHPESLQAETQLVTGTSPRTWITANFVVPHSTQALIVQLERRASERLDRKISGTLHVYQVSLLPVGPSQSVIADADKTRYVH